jgi:hypothetical protein
LTPKQETKECESNNSVVLKPQSGRAIRIQGGAIQSTNALDQRLYRCLKGKLMNRLSRLNAVIHFISLFSLCFACCSVGFLAARSLHVLFVYLVVSIRKKSGGVADWYLV